MNAIMVIAPYRHHGMWMFDDERVGLIQEPFVEGADALIDRWTADIADARDGFRLVFSSSAFPGFQHHLEWVRAEMSGNVYRDVLTEAEGWLCPALLKYFDSPPANIYVQCSALPRE